MKNSLKITGIALFAFAIGLTTANYAVSDVTSMPCCKFAVVDVPKIIAASSQVKALRAEQAKKNEEIAKFVETAKAAVVKEKDAAKKKALEEKYNKELKTKQVSIAKNYETKLLEIDKNISAVIDAKAKAGGYTLVLAKGVVLSGGTDITDEVAKQIK